MPSQIYFTGNYSFQDLHISAVTKNEYGIDVLVRDVSGGVPYLNTYMASLGQGNTWTYLNATWYLQTWSCDSNPVYPTVRQTYKGLANGVIPDPQASGDSIERSLSKSANTSYSVSYFDFTSQTNVTRNVSVTLQLQYITRRTSWKYLSKSTLTQAGTLLTFIPPSAPTYTNADVTVNYIPVIQIYSTDAGPIFSGGEVPLAVADAVSPLGYLVATIDSKPVWGTPYFENTDTVDQLLT